MIKLMKITESIDLRGEVCPYPELESRKKIRAMMSGEVLEIILDYPLSAERIPRTMRSSGHDVLSVEKIGVSEWKIIVRAK